MSTETLGKWRHLTKTIENGENQQLTVNESRKCHK